MMQVTLQGPAIIKVEDLAAFLQMAGVPAVVQLADCMVVSMPENPVVFDAGAQVNSTPKQRKPRESRKDNAQTNKSADPVADPAPAATTTTPEPEPAAAQATGNPGSPPPDTSALADRFMAFVDANYDGALALLKEFGVARFSELPAEILDNFESRLTEAGF